MLRHIKKFYSTIRFHSEQNIFFYTQIKNKKLPGKNLHIY